MIWDCVKFRPFEHTEVFELLPLLELIGFQLILLQEYTQVIGRSLETFFGSSIEFVIVTKLGAEKMGFYEDFLLFALLIKTHWVFPNMFLVYQPCCSLPELGVDSKKCGGAYSSLLSWKRLHLAF